MNFLKKLERKFGRFAIPNLTYYMVGLFSIGYLIEFLAFIGQIDSRFVSALYLNPAAIMNGEVWRLVSWLIVPPNGLSIFFIFTILFYAWIGKQLDNEWGSFVYNIYIFAGIILTDIGIVGGYVLGVVDGSVYISTSYLCLTMFLAFATCFPNMQILLFFVFPIKIKYLAYLDAAFLIYTLIITPTIGGKLVIIMMMLTFLIFFFSTRNYRKSSPKEIIRKRKYKKQVVVATKPNNKGYVHKCAICGRTEQDNPNLEFRFCSKCNGKFEYCQEHLFSHTHQQ